LATRGDFPWPELSDDAAGCPVSVPIAVVPRDAPVRPVVPCRGALAVRQLGQLQRVSTVIPPE